MSYFDAVTFVKENHAKQFRKLGGESYDNHLYRVADYVRTAGGSEEQLKLALLHDSIEDVKHVDYDYILDHFGGRMAFLVSRLTEEKSASWYERKVKYLVTVTKSPVEVQEVFIADKLDNITSMVNTIKNNNGDVDWDVFEGGLVALNWFWSNISIYVSKMPKFSEGFEVLRKELNENINFFIEYSNEKLYK
jgi:guanosine-3',5'-bis(diphosphate) 3'-pyrophosphohydrolase